MGTDFGNQNPGSSTRRNTTITLYHRSASFGPSDMAGCARYCTFCGTNGPNWCNSSSARCDRSCRLSVQSVLAIVGAIPLSLVGAIGAVDRRGGRTLQDLLHVGPSHVADFSLSRPLFGVFVGEAAGTMRALPDNHGRGAALFGARLVAIADALRIETFRLTRRPPFARDFKHQAQTEDAIDSVCRNIAEGFGCGSHAEFARFLEISRRSLNELLDCLRSAQLKGSPPHPFRPPLERRFLTVPNDRETQRERDNRSWRFGGIFWSSSRTNPAPCHRWRGNWACRAATWTTICGMPSAQPARRVITSRSSRRGARAANSSSAQTS